MLQVLAALCLLAALSVIQSAALPQQISLTVAAVGDNFTLKCPVSAVETVFVYWYKLKHGYMVQTIATGSSKITLEEQFRSPRFTVLKEFDRSSLTIRNVSREDEATYFCQVGQAYGMNFTNGTILVVNDHKGQQTHDYVRQSPESAAVQKGAWVTLQCALLSSRKAEQCPGEHSVHWFRVGNSQLGMVYARRNRSSEERSCVYSLSKSILDSSDVGIYYCAVITCGQILLGQGSNVETRQEESTLFLVFWTMLPCCIIVIVALILFRRQKSACEHCKGEVTASKSAESERVRAEDPLSNEDDSATTLNYAALDFTSRRAMRRNGDRDLQDSIYSGIRDCRSVPMSERQKYPKNTSVA